MTDTAPTTEKPLVFHRAIAKIEKTFLGVEDHGILTALLFVSYGSSSQAIGGYTLDEPRRDGEDKFIGRFGTDFGMEWVARCIRACGASSWEDLKGRTIHVLFDNPECRGIPLGIENLPTERGEQFVWAQLAAEFGAD